MKKRPAETLTVVQEFSLRVKKEKSRQRINNFAPVTVLIILLVFFSIFAQGFFSDTNLVAILNQMSIPMILALGATFVIIMGCIDLSVDGLMGLCGTLVSVMVVNKMTSNNLGFLGIVIAICSGVVIGLLTGLAYVRLRIPSFILTFGISNIAAGFALLLYKGIPVVIEDQILEFIARKSFIGIPIFMCIAIIIFAIGFIMQKYTAFGRYIYAIGDNESNTEAAGINVNNIKILVFAWSGLCIGIAGVLGAARLGQGDITIGMGNVFPAIIAVVVGGTSLSGGKGGVVNTLIGAAIITVIQNGLVLMSVHPYIMSGLQGLIIIAAVTFSITRNKNLINK